MWWVSPGWGFGLGGWGWCVWVGPWVGVVFGCGWVRCGGLLVGFCSNLAKSTCPSVGPCLSVGVFQIF